MICYSFPKPLYFMFSSDVPALLYYSHIPTAIVALLIGFFVFRKGKQFLINRLLFAISICFSFWVVSNLILWTNIHSSFMLFVWSFLRISFSLISILSVYFIYVFLEKKDVSILLKSIFLILTVPIIILSPTQVNLGGFNITSCDAFAFEGPLFQFSRVFFGILAMIWILVLLVRKYRKADVDFKKQILLMGIGMELFLFSFFIVTFLASYLTDMGILSDSRLEFYGLFGMDIFIGLLAYLIVRYKAFNIKLLGAQALVIGSIILIASQFSFIQNNTNRILTAVTLAMVTIFGWWLVKAVKKVDGQKEELDVAYTKLKRLDDAKTEFISISSHQLRTPIGIIRSVIDMIKDGTMDTLNKEQKDHFIDGAEFRVQKLEDIVRDILNAASFSNKKYNIQEKQLELINIPKLLEKVINSFAIETKEREITLALNPIRESIPEIYGERGYLEEVFSNLITNAIKYTPSPKKTSDIRNTRDGEAIVTINIEKTKDVDGVVVSVKDNGIGIPKDEISHLFQKFERAKNARDMYTDGTGLGLFLVREVVEGHEGKVWVESEEGKGSTFFVKLLIKPTGKINIGEYIKEHATA